MKKFSLALTVLITVALVAVLSIPAAAADHNYVGVKSCKMCHQAKDKGEQYQIWEKSQHSQAYAVLASDKAKEVGKAKGIDNPQQSPECLKCHVAGYGLPASRFEATYTKEEGVGCETCHGPGSDYKKITIMKNREQAIANGLIIPTAETCKQCHNPQSPTYPGSFNFEEMSKKIAHPIPPKAAQ
jgi:hypothetical protein